jgi:hypothetical protein
VSIDVAEPVPVCKPGYLAESPEHRFLKETFLRVLVDFSELQLFDVTEAQRRTFDFGCNLERDWTFPLVGQVDWRHRGGLDKDLRTLFGEPGLPLRALVMRDDMAHRLALNEIVTAHQRQRNDMYTLKVFPITPDFDADRQDHRDAVERQLRDRIANDILFNVVFGGISSDHVRFFALNMNWLGASLKTLSFDKLGNYGVPLAVLHHLATEPFFSKNAIASHLEISSSQIRQAVTILDGAGFIARRGEFTNKLALTLRGRVFLELLGRIWVAVERDEWDPELRFVLDRLGCEGERSLAVEHKPRSSTPAIIDFLVMHIIGAQSRWGLDIKSTPAYRDIVPDGPFGSLAGLDGGA